jgi:phage shock protein E
VSITLFASYVTLLVVSASESRRSSIEFTKDSLDVVKKNVLENKAVLVDVRSQEEWNKGYIEGSVFLPSTSFRKNVDPKYLAEKLPKNKIIYTFCVVGMRAKAVGKILQDNGYTVRVLKPGYEELVKAGFKKGKSSKESHSSAASDENTRQRNAGGGVLGIAV